MRQTVCTRVGQIIGIGEPLGQQCEAKVEKKGEKATQTTKGPKVCSAKHLSAGC